MAFSENHAVLTFGGPLFNATEEWSCSLRLLGTMPLTDSNEAAEDASCDAYAEAIRLQWIKTTNISSSVSSLAWVKFNKVDTAGHYRFPYTNRKDYSPAVAAGGSASNVSPAQVSQVVTLRTAASRGHAHAGRIFLPVPKDMVDGSGRISTTVQTAHCTWARDLLDAINQVDTTAYVGIASKVGAGLSRRVTRIEVGRVYDTMRSRRTKLAEEYQGFNLAP